MSHPKQLIYNQTVIEKKNANCYRVKYKLENFDFSSFNLAIGFVDFLSKKETANDTSTISGDYNTLVKNPEDGDGGSGPAST